MKTTEPVKHLVLVNPISGRGKGAHVAEVLPELYRNHGMEARVVLLEKNSDLKQVISQNSKDCLAVIGVGGDGTIAGIAGAIYHNGFDLPLGLIPLGLSNCLARHLNLPLDVERCVEILAQGKLGKIDLAVTPKGICLSFLGAGFDADVVRRVAEVRKGAIQDAAYISAALRTFFSSEWPKMKIEVDGRVIEGVYWQVIVSSITNYAHYFSMPPGEGFHAYLFRGHRPWSPLAAVVKSFAARSLVKGCDKIVPVKNAIRIEHKGQGGWYQFDGEAGAALPLECRVEPGGLNFIIP